MCDMMRSCVTWLIRVRLDLFICDTTHSCVTRLIHVQHGSFMCYMTQFMLIAGTPPPRGVVFVGGSISRGRRRDPNKTPGTRFNWNLASWDRSTPQEDHPGGGGGAYDQFGTWRIHPYSYLNRKWCKNNQKWIIYVQRDSFTQGATHLCVATYLCVKWLIHVRYDSFTYELTTSCATWLIHVFMRYMTHSYVTWLSHIWHDSLWRDMTHACETWSIHAWHDSFVCHRLIHTVYASLLCQQKISARVLFIFFTIHLLVLQKHSTIRLLASTFLLFCCVTFLCRYEVQIWSAFWQITGLFCWDYNSPFRI